MKKLIIMLVVGVLIQQIIRAQGTTYLSNVGQPSAGSLTVGSDSWYAALFVTGGNASGYVLNSVQLGMTDASGIPNGFTVMIYGEGFNPSAIVPGSSLSTLDGFTDPATGGIYTYTPTTDIVLSPGFYFIVLTAGTTVVNGAYDWSLANDKTATNGMTFVTHLKNKSEAASRY